MDNLKAEGGEASISEDKKEIRSDDDRKEERIMTKTIKIDGMMCAHCEKAVKNALEALSFVEEATPSHEKKEAVISYSGEFDTAIVKKAVEDAGYTFIGII